jgi:hypothetical protein
MAIDQLLIDAYLDRAVEQFDSNPVSTQLIRRLANDAPEMFVTSALRHLSTPEQSNALRFLSIMLLHQQSALLARLSNPLESKQKTIGLFQRVLAVDPAFDVKLARQLPDRVGNNHHEALRGARAARTLDVLDATSRGRRLLPILGHLVDSDDPRTREKATLFVGKRVHSPVWAEKQLKRADDRVRANAVESIWGLNTKEARSLLELCAGDKVNRVAGNALVGLHLAGGKGIVDEVNRMANEFNPRFRSTAAWSMGKMGDISFMPRLTELVKDEQPMVRGAALRSLIELRRVEVNTPEAIVARAKKNGAVDEETAGRMIEVAAEVVVPTPKIDVRLDGSSFATHRR